MQTRWGSGGSLPSPSSPSKPRLSATAFFSTHSTATRTGSQHMASPNASPQQQQGCGVDDYVSQSPAPPPVDPPPPLLLRHPLVQGSIQMTLTDVSCDSCAPWFAYSPPSTVQYEWWRPRLHAATSFSHGLPRHFLNTKALHRHFLGQKKSSTGILSGAQNDTKSLDQNGR